MTTTVENASMDPKQAKVIHQWKAAAPLIDCRFSPQKNFVVAALENRTLARFSVPDGKVEAWEGHEAWPLCLAIAPDASTVVSGGSDDRLIWWHPSDSPAKAARVVQAHRGWIRSVDISPDGKFVVSGGNDGKTKLWEAATGKLLGDWGDHEREVYTVRFHPTGSWLLSGDLKGNVIQRELPSGKVVRTFAASALHSYNGGQRVDYGGVRDLCVSPDGKRLAAAGLFKASNPLGAVNQPLVLTFDWESGKAAQQHSSDVKGVAWRAVFHSSGMLIGGSGGSGGGYLLFWEAKQEKPIVQFKLPNTARGMDMSPDGVWFATAHYDRHLRITQV